MMYLKYALGVLLAVVVVWALVNVVRIQVLSKRAGVYIESTTPFTAAGSGSRILVLGDSLAYGTGTSSPEKSVAGLVVSAYSDPYVENLAKNGKRTKDLAAEVDNIAGQYDLILVIVGGNDAIRPQVNLKESAKHLEKVYARVSKHSKQSIVLTTGDLKDTNLFLPPLNYYFSTRSKTLRDSAKLAASNYHNVAYIDMVAYSQKEPFTKDMEADDRLHLSDKGSQYWFEAIKSHSPIGD